LNRYTTMRQEKRPLRVAFVIDTLVVGGTETQVRILIREMDRSRVVPYLVCLKDEEAPARESLGCAIANLDVHSLVPPDGLRGVLRLRRLLRAEDIDIVVTFFPDSEAIGGLAARTLGTPVIASRRNIGHWHTPWKLRQQKLVNRLTNRIVANSQAARQAAIAKEGIGGEKITVIYNALDAAKFAAGPQQARDGFRICCVANLREVKGHRYLLEAFARLLAEIPAAQLDLIGEGEQRAMLQNMCEALSIQGSVAFLGSRLDVAELLPSYDLGVLPSLAESFSNTILEYMAAGLPVAATDVGGNGEVVDDTVGRLVPPADPCSLAAALLELAGDADLRRSLGRAGRQRVEARFGVLHVLEDWYSVFESVVGRIDA
jgi:glycosyltransferase involved in cell wall biosynthesis